MKNITAIKRCVLLVVLLFAIPGVGLVGCHPCVFAKCGRLTGGVVKAVAYTGAHGEIYIDIENRSKYKITTLSGISISSIKNKRFGIDFWSVMKTLQSRQKTIGDSDDFPIQYGVTPPDMQVEIAPVKIENGVYSIWGLVALYDNEGRRTLDAIGKFSYTNGIVKNLN